MTAQQQADEHLRRALADDAVRHLVTEIADHLTANLPTALMRDGARLYLASAKGAKHNGLDSDRAAATTRALLATMPASYPGETRGEYALRLRAAARSAR